MKHKKLHSVAHNFADSLASGLGFVVGYFPTDIFADAAANEDGSITVDFLLGEVHGQTRDHTLRHAIPLYRREFPEFCRKHDVSKSDFRLFQVRYTLLGLTKGFSVTIEDRNGRTSTRKYVGLPGKRVKNLDDLGRIRK